MEKNRLNILYPGSFKPVHAGHLYMIDNYLKGDPDHSVQLYVLISAKERDGITAESTLNFLNNIFGRFPNFHASIINGSPIRAAYDMTATKQLGDGCYALAASTKEDDVKRALDYNINFSKDGKYYTPGVKPLLLIPDALPAYTNRTDDFNESPISARIVRKDIMNDDYNAFLTAYQTPLCPSYVTENLLRQYYKVLLSLITTPINEGGAAGHINHPYDDSDLTFGEIKEMINAIFKGEVEDITEKIDGINILASVDEQGKIIFARNKQHLLNTPMHMDDVLNNNTWNIKTKESFIAGTEAIEKVFNNLKDKVKFFNMDDSMDGCIYRDWISVEIVDHSNMNVIPYVENFVSFHNHIFTVCTTYTEERGQEKRLYTSPNQERQIYELDNAIQKTNRTDKGYKAQLSPKMIFVQNNEGEFMAKKHLDELIDLMEDYDMTDLDTIGTYKQSAMLRYVLNNEPSEYLTREELELLADRWSGAKSVRINTFKKKEDKNNVVVKRIQKFEKELLPKLKKRIMLPLDQLFIGIGNDALKLFTGGKNAGKEDSTIRQIKTNMTKAISAIEETGDERALDKLEYMLLRLGDTIDVNASEGIVFRYHGRLYKLTGSFSVLNQIINLSKSTK